MHIDFGAGMKMDILKERCAKFSDDDIVIGIDRRTAVVRPGGFTPEFSAFMNEYYELVDNMWVRVKPTPFRLYDCYIHGDIRDDFDIDLSADTWACVATLEHVPDDEVEDFFTGLKNKISKDSEGHLHVDLSDHKKPPGFFHYENAEYASELRENYSGLFLNRIRKEEWFKIIDKHFTYNIWPSDGQFSVSLGQVRLK
jgi:hypothetical protein